MTDLAGRKVLVVGAGTRPSPEPDAPIGNGRAIAVVVGRAGATVACADVDTDAAASTAALVEAEGATAHVLAADVSDAAQCEQVVDDADAAMGGLDGLVCNVGIDVGARHGRARPSHDHRDGASVADRRVGLGRGTRAGADDEHLAPGQAVHVGSPWTPASRWTPREFSVKATRWYWPTSMHSSMSWRSS